MNREEAIKEIPHQTGTIYGTEELINEIYDDFESRTCENCEHAMPSDNDSMIICPMLGLTRSIKWNCGDFERKQDDNL